MNTTNVNIDRVLSTYLAALIGLSTVELAQRFFRQQDHAAVWLLFIICAINLIGTIAIWYRWHSRLWISLGFLIPVGSFLFADVLLSNHMFWLIWNLMLFALFWRDGSQTQQQLLMAVKVMIAAVLVWSGVQKIMHGAWFHAETLCAIITVGDQRFAALFNALGAVEDLAYCRGLTIQPGSGPFDVRNTLVVLAANATLLAELILPFFLFLEKTRKVALVGLVLMLAGIQVFAFEVFFGLHVINALTLFVPSLIEKYRIRYSMAIVALAIWSKIFELQRYPPP